MQLNIQTSYSSMIPITDFKYIYDLARCTKRQSFIVLQSTNKLYGVSDDCSSISVVDIPFKVNTDLFFRYDKDIRVIVENNSEFFIPFKFNHVILPSFYWDMYINGDIVSLYDQSKDQFILYDKSTSLPIADQIQMYKYRDFSDHDRKIFFSQLESFLLRKNTLSTPYTFKDMQLHPDIRSAFDNKASAGRVLCKLMNAEINIAFYFFKGLFSLAKNDTLELNVHFDRFERNKFMIEYKPRKRKNPLVDNKYGIAFAENVYCMYISIL